MAVLKNKVKYHPVNYEFAVTFTMFVGKGIPVQCTVVSSGIVKGKPSYVLLDNFGDPLGYTVKWAIVPSPRWICVDAQNNVVLDNYYPGDYPLTENGFTWNEYYVDRLSITSSVLTSTCITYALGNNTTRTAGVDYIDCEGRPSYITVPAFTTLYICASEKPVNTEVQIKDVMDCQGETYGEIVSVNNINIGVNQENYGGSPYTGWYRTSDLINDVAGNGVVAMYKKLDSVDGSIDTSAGGCRLIYSNNPAYFTMSDEWTIEGWFRMNGLPSQEQYLFASDGTYFPSFRIENGTGSVYIDYNGDGEQGTNYTFPSGQWVHIALTCVKNRFITLWVDGELQITLSFVQSGPQFDPSEIGVSCNPNNNQSFEGQISNFRIINGTAIYPVESVSGSTPYWNVNKSYDDTVLVLRGAHINDYLVDSGRHNLSYISEQDIQFSELTPPVKPTIDVTLQSTSLTNKNVLQSSIVKLINGHPKINEMGGPFISVDSAVDSLYTYSGISNAILVSSEYPSIDEYEQEFLTNYTNLYDAGCLMSYPSTGSNIYNLKRMPYDNVGFGTIVGQNFLWRTDFNGMLEFATSSPSYLGIDLYQTGNGFEFHFVGQNAGGAQFAMNTIIAECPLFRIVGLAGTNNIQFAISGLGVVGTYSINILQDAYFVGLSYNMDLGIGIIGVNNSWYTIQEGSTTIPAGVFTLNVNKFESVYSQIKLYVLGYVDDCRVDDVEMGLRYDKFWATYNQRYFSI